MPAVEHQGLVAAYVSCCGNRLLAVFKSQIKIVFLVVFLKIFNFHRNQMLKGFQRLLKTLHGANGASVFQLSVALLQVTAAL